MRPNPEERVSQELTVMPLNVNLTPELEAVFVRTLTYFRAAEAKRESGM